jgi:hypothetical protein
MITLPYQRAFHWIRSAYLDAPGEVLSAERVHDKSGVARDVCGQVLEDLVRAGFLMRASNGHYVRSTRSHSHGHASRAS